MPADDNPTVHAGLDLAARGWPVMPIKPRGKEPLTPHGVKDATTVERVILHWFDRWPDANLAIATGLPGPQVLDVDQPDSAREVLREVERLHPPTSATARGRHLFFAGIERGTISLGYGELRGTGSYVVVPPSIHPTGKEYTWLQQPTGPLPAVPTLLIAQRSTAGAGAFEAPARQVPHGGRHDFLKDIAVRAVRAGITDQATLILVIKAAYETHCVKTPKARPNEFASLATWAAGTDIADRERERAPEPQVEEEEPAKAKKGKSGLGQAPAGTAPLGEHRAYLRHAGGWGDRIDIKTVMRFGNRPVDALEVELTNGQRIVFDRQDQVTTRGHWVRTVIACTNGIADPAPLSDRDAQKVYRSLCIIADAPPEAREVEDLQDVVDDLLAIAEPITEQDLTDAAGRYTATAVCRARKPYDPRDRNSDAQPAVIVDRDGRRYLRAGELRDYLNYRGLAVSAQSLTGRMRMLGASHLTVNGREPARDTEPRRTNRMWLYQLPDDR